MDQSVSDGIHDHVRHLHRRCASNDRVTVTGSYPLHLEQFHNGGANFAPLVSPIMCEFTTPTPDVLRIPFHLCLAWGRSSIR